MTGAFSNASVVPRFLTLELTCFRGAISVITLTTGSTATGDSLVVFLCCSIFTGFLTGALTSFTGFRYSIISTILLTVFALGGIYIFHFFGISVGAFQITGGIVLITIGLKLLRGEGKKIHASHFEADDVMIVPIAIPMLGGAGAITTVVVYMSEGPTYFEIAVLLLAILINGLLAYIILKYSVIIKKVFKEHGLRVLNKLMGLIVLSMAVEFILHGLVRVGAL